MFLQYINHLSGKESHLRNIIILLTFIVSALLIGVLVGALDYRKAIDDVKLTDVISALLTFLGIFLAYFSYHRWLSDKKREESYLVAKKYLSAMDQAKELADELTLHFRGMCPSPGLIIEHEEVYARKIERVHDVWGQLYEAMMSIKKSQRELSFWNVSLSKNFKLLHEQLNTELRSLAVITETLNNRLFHYHIKGAEIRSEVLREKEMFDSRMLAVNEIFEQRATLGFDKVFVF